MKNLKILIKHPDNALIILIIAMHFWALIAFNHPTLRKVFLPLTPLTMALCTVIAYRSYKGSATAIAILSVIIYTIGFGIEVLGVNTGFPFGQYTYGSPLGPKAWNTPIIIGLNWFIMFSGVLYAIERLRLSQLLKALIGAGLMTAADVVIEPVAIYLNFWQWEKGLPPSENYIGWFGVALSMFLLYYRFFHYITVTKRAFWVVIIFVLFFIMQNLLI